ncbi:hypothetical protein OAD22_00050 [Pseudomonadales bacterium]|nr:hypothetical protein [Pseudomonadales bacterium]
MTNDLKKDFEARKDFYANRASAIYPIYFVDKSNDLLLSWLNYWTVKNGIDAEKIAINIRIYNANGDLKVHDILQDLQLNNLISIRTYIEVPSFSGMVEVEVVSCSNLKFTFPALIGIYKSKSLYSCVHSAGRIKGSDEIHTPSLTTETNWTCKFGNGVTPFFHYINGNCAEAKQLSVNLYSSSGVLVESATINENLNPFASRLFLIDEMFNDVVFEAGMFVGVECANDSVFRRMVVGNYHKKLSHLEVTHSFPKQVSKDLCPKVEGGVNSFLAIYSDNNLDVTARVFPTNIKGHFTSEIMEQRFSDKRLVPIERRGVLEKGFGSVSLAADIKFMLVGFKGAVPSRFNTNFLYKVKDSQSSFSTDIATGAKSSVYPPKFSHWGSGVFGDGYDFVLMIRNNNHDGTSSKAKGKLKFYGLGKSKGLEVDVELEAESSISISLSDLLRDSRNSPKDELCVFTWFMLLDQPNSETFWISYRKADGCILGEHGF